MHRSTANQLLIKLVDCDLLLDNCNELMWRDKLRETRIVDAAGSEALDLDLLLSYFSQGEAFFELEFSKDCGHRLSETTEAGANSHLITLRLDIYYLAQRCREEGNTSIVIISACP
ncbi:hypothetical protein [Pseudovibrio sp. Tun.PSC04-5.I4]|uniref:hypothetical protein n=1 Tax=Pseudovibrio sp. Tun.PSC04-5.I4 TaxID=1798213 RepID=UPI00088549AC|nr:hypothetical protein [Pseudovibrio sp. Tun.PSC04-5.I4]SDQ94262.1 hypothetical protein SAMN04515695_1988 [Pseudovibrio sp. Tun.PSC04-5.I4]